MVSYHYWLALIVSVRIVHLVQCNSRTDDDTVERPQRLNGFVDPPRSSFHLEDTTCTFLSVNPYHSSSTGIVKEAHCDPASQPWCREGVVSYQRYSGGPLLVTYTDASVHNWWRHIYYSMTENVRGLDDLEGYCFKTLVVGKTSTLNFYQYNVDTASRDHITARRDAMAVFKAYMRTAQQQAIAEQQGRDPSSVQFWGYSPPGMELLRRGVGPENIGLADAIAARDIPGSTAGMGALEPRWQEEAERYNGPVRAALDGRSGTLTGTSTNASASSTSASGISATGTPATTGAATAQAAGVQQQQTLSFQESAAMTGAVATSTQPLQTGSVSAAVQRRSARRLAQDTNVVAGTMNAAGLEVTPTATNTVVAMESEDAVADVAAAQDAVHDTAASTAAATTTEQDEAAKAEAARRAMPPLLKLVS